IIFTDIRMPHLNGLEMLRRLRALPGYENTPIVAVSASSLEHERHYYLTQGFQEFIGKPYAFDDVFSALKHYLHVAFDTDNNISEPEPADDTPVDLSLIANRLKELAEAAASGEMSVAKKIITAFTTHQLGKHRH